MKKISFAVIALSLMLCMFAFTACGGGSDDSRPELTLTTNIEGAGTVSGGGSNCSGICSADAKREGHDKHGKGQCEGDEFFHDRVSFHK